MNLLTTYVILQRKIFPPSVLYNINLIYKKQQQTKNVI